MIKTRVSRRVTLVVIVSQRETPQQLSSNHECEKSQDTTSVSVGRAEPVVEFNEPQFSSRRGGVADYHPEVPVGSG